MEGQNIALIIWTYICPSIIIVGTVGNVLSLMAVTNRHCRKSSFTVYLAALAITDTTYLYACVLPDWLTNVFAFRLGSYGNTWCKVTWFLSFLTSQSSSWLIAALTAERMFCTYFPHKTKAVCVPRTGYSVAGMIIGVLFLLNGNLLYAVQETKAANNNTISLGTTCGIIVPEYETVYANIVAWIDLGLYFLLPLLVIVIANSATVVGVLKMNALTAALMAANSNRIKHTRHLLIVTFLVSSAFVIFLSPMMIFGVVMPHFLEDTALLHKTDGGMYYLIFASLSNWSYLNHAVNFFLYILSGERFRRELKNVFCKPSAERFTD